MTQITQIMKEGSRLYIKLVFNGLTFRVGSFVEAAAFAKATGYIQLLSRSEKRMVAGSNSNPVKSSLSEAAEDFSNLSAAKSAALASGYDTVVAYYS